MKNRASYSVCMADTINTLETERLLLRGAVQEDARAFAAYNAKEEFYRYLPIDPPTLESTDAYIKHLIAQRSSTPRLNHHLGPL